MGASGIISNTLINPIKSLSDPNQQWRWVYLATFSLTVNLYTNYFAPAAFFSDDRSSQADVPIPSLFAHVLGGLLVGFGTRMGNGCTTGHGICGISRFSKRSIAATIVFTAMGMLTTYAISPVRPWSSMTAFLRSSELPKVSPAWSAIVMASTVLAAMAAAPTMCSTRTDDDKCNSNNSRRKTLAAALSGSMFAAGLAVSGMTKNSKVHDFLCISGLDHGTFDPTLVAVLGSAILTSVGAYQMIKGYSNLGVNLECPLALEKNSKFSIPTNTIVDIKLLGGATIFGLGWGLTGVCPGPAIFSASSGVMNAIVAWIPAFLVGSFISNEVKQKLEAAEHQKKKN